MNVRQVIPKDAIPSVDDPEFGDEYDGDFDDDVIVLESETEPARAYPIRFLHYHEIVNDQLGDDPVAVTWCPLCGSAVTYSRVVDGRTLTFGVSGKLADDDLVMYDRETGSEWKQSTGRAIAGPLEGETLNVLPAAMTTVEAFTDNHADGVVLRPPGGKTEARSPGDTLEPVDYDAGAYETYFETDGFGLAAHRGTGSRDWTRDDLDPKTVVVGLEADGDALGLPLPRIQNEGGVVTVTVGNSSISVFATSDGVHAFENSGFAFEPAGDGDRFRGDGTTWHGATGASDDGRHLERAPVRRLFAFAWQDDHGPDAFYE